MAQKMDEDDTGTGASETTRPAGGGRKHNQVRTGFQQRDQSGLDLK